MQQDNTSICVLGLGYIGLPTASLFAVRGAKVIGVDVHPKVVETINQGSIHIEEPGLDALVQSAVHSGRLQASTEPAPADAFILAVPTPFKEGKKADLSYVESATRALLPHLKKGNLVILESTSPPGTTDQVVLPILEESGMKAGEDFFLAHCPERVLPGRILIELVENARVIGGVTPACAQKAADLYGFFVEGEIHQTSARTAEMVKLMENTYRDVNIALANELARICEGEGISAWEVADLANLHPRVNLHSPGPGVGGHCISVDPWFIVERHPETARIIGLARDINDSVPAHLAKEVLAVTSDKPVVAVLGVAYKGNVDDVRESPALELIAKLQEGGATVRVHDPHVETFQGARTQSLEQALQGAEAAVLVADHQEFRDLNPQDFTTPMASPRVFDTRNMWDPEAFSGAGVMLHRLGDGAKN